MFYHDYPHDHLFACQLSMFGRDKTFGIGGLVQLSCIEGNQNIEYSLVMTTAFFATK